MRLLRSVPLPLVFAFALLAGGGGKASAQELEQALNRVASAWHRGDAATISTLGARTGIAIEIDGSSVGPLGPRQAAAVLRRVFDERESVSVKGNMSREVGGSPVRGFGEITWTAKARGTTIPERATVFVAFVRDDSAWRITEIRLLR